MKTGISVTGTKQKNKKAEKRVRRRQEKYEEKEKEEQVEIHGGPGAEIIFKCRLVLRPLSPARL